MAEKVVLRIQLSPEEYRRLKNAAEEQGYQLVSDYVRDLISQALESGAQSKPRAGVSQEIRRLERRIADLLNPYTGKLDEIMRRLGEIQEMLESCTGAGEREVQARPEPEPQRARPQRQWRGEERPRRQVTAIERLREQKVVTLSDVQWMRVPEKFFDKLRREGAVVFRVGREMVAVDPDYWSEFLAVLGRYSVRDPEELAALLEGSLGEPAAKLFRLLARYGVAFYDDEEGIWIVEVGASR